MKKVLITSFVLFILFSSCKKNNENQNSETSKKEISEIDNLFNSKDKISKNEQLNFLGDFYALTVVDTMLKKDNTINRIALTDIITKLVKDDGFNGTEIDKNKLNEVLTKSKTKNELANAIYNNDEEKSLMTDGLFTYEIEKLTKDIFKIYQKNTGSMGGSDLLFKYENDKFSAIDEEKLEKLVSPSLNLLSKKLNRKFERQNAKYNTYTSTVIDGEKYFTIPYFENYKNGAKEIDGSGYSFNLLIACNGDKFYYLYDDPRTENDNWEYEENESKPGFVEFGSTGVSKNPKWISIK